MMVLSPRFPWVLCAQGTGESRGWARALVAASSPSLSLSCAPVCIQQGSKVGHQSEQRKRTFISRSENLSHIDSRLDFLSLRIYKHRLDEVCPRQAS